MNDDDGPEPVPRRIAEGGLVLLAVATMGVWCAALLQSMPPPAPSVVVQGEPLVPEGSPLALRITAARPGARTQSVVSGEVTSGAERAAVENGRARLEHVSGPVMMHAIIDGDIEVQGRLKVQEAKLRLGPPKLLFFAWRSEVQAMMHQGPRLPVYPLDGRVAARLNSRVLRLEESGPVVVDLQPQATGAMLDDGRVLAVDRSGLRLTAPLEVDQGGTVTVAVESAEPRDVSLDLVVDGAVQDVARVHVEGRVDVPLRLGKSEPGDVVVVHAGGVWPDELGRFAVLRVKDPATPLASWVDQVSTRNGAPEDEPLLAWLRAHPAEANAADGTTGELLRAALGRLKPVKLRAPKLQLELEVSSPLGPRLRVAYGVMALLVVLAVGGLGMMRLPGKRGSVVLLTLAVAMLLGGLFAALLVIAGV